jgi:hypothetical protein
MGLPADEKDIKVVDADPGLRYQSKPLNPSKSAMDLAYKTDMLKNLKKFEANIGNF